MSNLKPLSYSQKLIKEFEEKGDKTFDLEDIKELIENFSKNEYEKRKAQSNLMPFGKYKYKPVKDVAKFDKQYLKWLRKQDMLENYEELKNEIDKYLK